MALEKIVKIQYCTEERVSKINPDNLKKYEKYLQSSILKNPDMKDTTYKTYFNGFRQFLVYLSEDWDNIDLYSEKFMDNAVDIMEGFMAFCQFKLENHKKVINTKLSTVSSFYIWSVKRKYVKYHPFKDSLDRMKKASEEHILNSYYLDNEQLSNMRQGILNDPKNTIQDLLLFEIALFSGNRLGALSNLTLSTLNIDDMVFENIREKEGYIVDVSLDEECINLINEWLEERKQGYDDMEVDSLFVHFYQDKWKAWSRDMIYTRFKKYGKYIGIDDFRPHCMRKSSINKIYEETGDLNLASQWANHKSTAVTQMAYIKPASKSDLREKLNKLKEKKEKEKAQKKD